MSEHEAMTPDDGPTIPYYIPPPRAPVAPAPEAPVAPAEQMQVPTYSPPSAVAAAPNAYAAPSNTYAAPSNTFAAPSNTFAVPPSTYAAPSNPFATAAPTAPANPYPAPPNGFGTPYAPPLNAYPPANPYGGSPYPSYPPPSGPTARPRLERYALWGLILSLFSALIFSIPCAIVALVRTKGGRKRGRGMAVAALAISMAWVVFYIAAYAYHQGRKPTRSADGSITHQGSFSPVNLRTGDCFLTPPLVQGQPLEIRNVTVLPCSTPHNAQVFDVLTTRDTTYPGESALLQEALHDCVAPAQSYLGKPSATLNLVSFVPDTRLWDLGNRKETCVLVDSTGDITGDIRGH